MATIRLSKNEFATEKTTVELPESSHLYTISSPGADKVTLIGLIYHPMDEELCFQWSGKRIPVTHPSIDRELALRAIESEQFKTWCTRCETTRNNKRIEIHGVEIQSVDLFGRG